jgi:GLPGLI family protein
LSAFAAFAQKPFEGRVEYDVTINMHRRIPPEREQMKAMIPEFKNEKYELFFRDNEALYLPIEEDDPEEDANMNNSGRRRFNFRISAAETYQNTENNSRIEVRDVMGKKYLITDSLKVPAWKLEEETKVILGYTCKKAVVEMDNPFMKSKMLVTAWYAEKLPLPVGPDMIHSLPGTILEVDVNDGEMVTKATKVDLRKLKKNEMRVPKEGKKVTREEFRAEMEELRKNMPGGGFMMGR